VASCDFLWAGGFARPRAGAEHALDLTLHDLEAKYGACGTRGLAAGRLENVSKGGYFSKTQGFAMNAACRTTKTIMRRAASRCVWRWPLAFGITLALVVSLLHDLPALAGTASSDAIPVAAMASTSTPAQPSDSHALAVGCHCLCHLAAQAVASPIVTPVIFNDSLRPLRDSTGPRSCAGLPPFRPPRA
jgi:hypothetical protein